MRWAVFVFDPTGDMGDGAMVGPFRSAEKADEKAEKLRAYEPACEPVVVPLMEGSSSLRNIVDRVIS